MTAMERGVLILYDVADMLYGPRKRRMTNEKKLTEFLRLLPRMSAAQRGRVLSAATAAGIEDFESVRRPRKEEL